MSYYSIPLKAGQPFKQNTSGTLLLIDSLGSAAGVDVMLTKKGGSDGARMPNRQTAFRLVEPFEGVTFTAAVDTVLGVFLSNSDVQLGLTSGSAISLPGGAKVTNTDPDAIPVRAAAGQRLPVDIGGGNVTVTATEVGISNDDTAAVPVRKQKLSTLVHLPGVAVAANAAPQQIVNDATLRTLIINNNSTSGAIALGGAGVTLANAAIVLQPGQSLIEEAGAGVAWYAVSDIGAGDIRIMGMK